MKIVIKEKYKGELREKREKLIKALFPEVHNVEEKLELPDHKLKEPAAQDIAKRMDKDYEKMMTQMLKDIEEVVKYNRGK